LYKEINLNDRVVEVNKIGFEKLIVDKVENTFSNIDTIRNNYENVNLNIYKESLEYYNAVKNWCYNLL